MNKDQVISALFEKIDFLSNELAQVKKENQELKRENAEIKKAFTEVKLENADLKVRITELEARLNSNSSNSSKPPSSDGYKKKPAFPRKKKGKQGGQQGHKGRTLQQVEHPDKTVKHKPGQCDCGHVFSDEELSVAETRQVFDLPQPKLEVTAHQLLKGKCPVCGKWHKASAPEGVNAPVQYGRGVKTLATLLNVDYRIPFKKLQILFSDLFGYAINESTVYSASRQCYEMLEPTEEVIKSGVVKSDATHADETGLRVAGKLHWLHTASSLLYTYLFVHERRGRVALDSEKSVLNRISGWLVHDCWSSYFKYHTMHHAICGAHILRELEGLIENGQSKWPRVFKTFLMNVFEMPLEERVKRRDHIEKRFSLICGLGEKAEPPPRKTPGKRGKYKRTKGRNLVERLIRNKEAVLAFAFNREVPFTNNLAERDIRPAKVKQKVSNCFRTLSGAEIYARIAGFVSTARKNDRNVFTELFNTFEGHNFIVG
ncbi:MAG: IS66 family transposase [Bacteroidetes bacterium]|nr:IS66 family transposase [Bacteroidota bacterium]MBL7113294.1 IS66 family transposase [Bacteroidales bacterium]